MKMSCRTPSNVYLSTTGEIPAKKISGRLRFWRAQQYCGKFESMHLIHKPGMRYVLIALLMTGCMDTAILHQPGPGEPSTAIHKKEKVSPSSKKYEPDSWQSFLQHIPVSDGPVLDYTGQKIPDQGKHFAILTYDVGKRDLQQCADALIRLRAEYLFTRKRPGEIGFHFTGGQFYSFDAYCNGKRPVPKGNEVAFINKEPVPADKASLRQYLDLVYTYAGTISLAKELKPTNRFEVGTVVIYAGSPGHCFIITDEAVNEAGEKVFKLVEGYTPAQTIYVLRNVMETENTPWHTLNHGTIKTASYTFTRYRLGKFE